MAWVWLWPLFAALLALPASAACERSYLIPIWNLGYANFMEADGTPRGIFGDLYREVAARSGCRFRYESIPLMRINLMVQAHQVFVRSPTGIPQPDEGKQIVFIPMMRDTIHLLVAKSKRDQLDLGQPLGKSLVFGTLRGAHYGDWADQWLARLPEGQVEQVNGIDSLYRMLAAGRIHATFANAYVYRWQLKTLQIEDEFVVLPVPGAREVVLGVKLDKQAMSAADFELVARQFEAVRDDGTFGRLVARYLGEAQAHENTAGMVKLPRQAGG